MATISGDTSVTLKLKQILGGGASLIVLAGIVLWAVFSTTISPLRDDVNAFRGDVTGLRGDIGKLQESYVKISDKMSDEQMALSHDIVGLRGDLQGFHGDFNVVRLSLETIETKVDNLVKASQPPMLPRRLQGQQPPKVDQ
jgi:hypothetical protein